MLPEHVRALLLSATVGNAADFVIWLSRQHGRTLRLIQGTERKVTLQYHWVEDMLLNELLQEMADGDDTTRKTPALVFCFNRDVCWDVAEQLKGRDVVNREQQKLLAVELDQFDWSEGVGPKLKQILMRGVGVHHAGLLPKYRRIVERLFQQKLLSVAVCTETLSAGINLPARSVVLTSLLKGPPGKKKVIDASSAHQIFGRAGRPQFDTEGHVYALAHEDDVKILKWKEKYDVIPEDTKDPNLRKALKRIRKKMPTRRKTEQYWNEEQFQKLIAAPPGKLASRGTLPWRLLAYLLHLSPDVSRLRTVVDKRLMEPKQLEAGHRALNEMLLSLWAGGFAKLDPPPPAEVRAIEEENKDHAGNANDDTKRTSPTVTPAAGTLGALINAAREEQKTAGGKKKSTEPVSNGPSADHTQPAYEPMQAEPTPRMQELLAFRSVNPMYGTFLVSQMDIADPHELIQALESVLEVSGSVARLVRVPREHELPQGRLAMERLNLQLLDRGLASPAELSEAANDEADLPPEERVWTLRLGDKLRRLFDAEFPGVRDVRTRPVWVVGDVLEFNGDFNAYVTARKLAKQEGILFRHLLRFILLCGEFRQVPPPNVDPTEWDTVLRELADRIAESCRKVDPISTDDIFAAAAANDLFAAEATDQPPVPNSHQP